MWFNNWGRDLVELGFTSQPNNNEDIHIPNDQIARIINFDETCLSLDGSGRRGGKPEVVFYNPLLLQVDHGTSKSSLTTMMIMGSNALGAAIPSLFQLQTLALSEKIQHCNDTTIFFQTAIASLG